MKESNFVSLVLGMSECKEFDLAIRLLEGAEAVYAEQDVPPEDVFASMYNLRGQVFLKQAKKMIAESQEIPEVASITSLRTMTSPVILTKSSRS